ncbi:MAG TPA: 30S ribosomal protein S4 [Armatimonadetes bacterium]|nr:30S ribosomal protein S4 [Armatimonadota bacterium]
MARYIGPKCRLCRREGTRLFLKGEKCLSPKCPLLKRGTAPGEHGARRPRLSEYGIRLREKQKCKRIYGMLEAQFKRYFEMAERMPGDTGKNLLQLLERRLDNVIYRCGFASSRAQARQIVNHGHVKVNGRRADIPSYLVDPGDEIEVEPLEVVRENAEKAAGRRIPEWLEVDLSNLRAKVLKLPTREMIDTDVDEHLIVEFYSR